MDKSDKLPNKPSGADHPVTITKLGQRQTTTQARPKEQKKKLSWYHKAGTLGPLLLHSPTAGPTSPCLKDTHARLLQVQIYCASMKRKKQECKRERERVIGSKFVDILVASVEGDGDQDATVLPSNASTVLVLKGELSSSTTWGTGRTTLSRSARGSGCVSSNLSPLTIQRNYST